jgi:hypothetical protein
MLGKKSLLCSTSSHALVYGRLNNAKNKIMLM